MGLIKRIRQAIKIYKWARPLKQENIKKFLYQVKKESLEYQEVIEIINKYSRRESITPEENLKFKKKFADTLKIIGIGIPFILIPGSSVILPVVIKVTKKYNINLLPSSFENEKK
jgi:hypothetical protein